MKRNNIQSRHVHTEAVEFRMAAPAEGEARSRRVEGYAFLFNSRTNIGWFDEVILPGAADQALVNSCDIRALLNHDPNQLLARCKNGSGTMELKIDERGLWFSFELPESRGDVLEMLERGDLTQCSFSFTLEERKWTVYDDDRLDLREIVRFKELYDITLATYPAYADTSAALRCRDNYSAPIIDNDLIDLDTKKRHVQIASARLSII